MFIDKRKACKRKYRIPEDILMLIAILMGCFGIFVGMILFRHKTKKIKFKLVYLLIFIYLFCFYMYVI